MTFPKAKLNGLLSRREFDKVIPAYKKYLKLISLAGFGIGILIIIINIIVYVGATGYLMVVIMEATFFVALDCALYCSLFWSRTIMISFELKYQLIVISLGIGTTLRIISCYIFVIPLNLGVDGIYISDLFVTLLRIALTNYCVFNMNFSKFEGVRIGEEGGQNNN